MGKNKVEELLYNFSFVNDFADSNYFIGNSSPKTLSASIKYLDGIQSMNTNPFIGFCSNKDLSENKVREITQILADAIDKNSVEEIKNIKTKYGNSKEFANAKKILNEKCKILWNVFEIENEKIPYQAMKTLGISNIPSLDFLLENSIKFFEKDDCQTTSRIINSILNNKNLNYTIEDIHKYLINKNANLNYNTVKYLIEKQKYNEKQLQELNVSKAIIKKALKKINFKNSFIYYIKNLKIA